jgi:hypothetical protein
MSDFLRRYLMPGMAAAWFVVVLANSKYRQGLFDARTSQAAEQPILFTPTPTGVFMVLGALILASFILGRYRRWLIGSTAALLAAMILLLVWMNSHWPDGL